MSRLLHLPAVPRGGAWPRWMMLLASSLVVPCVALPLTSAHASGADTVTGSVWNDANRDGLFDAGESAFGGLSVDLADASGNPLAATVTAADGSFSFNGLADGTYTVNVDPSTWMSMRDTYVPTTTGSLYYKRTVSVSGGGTGVANIGLRSIVRSTSLSSPISSVTTASGTVVNSYDDAVTAVQVASALAQGSEVTAEAGRTTVYFDYGSQTDATTSVGGSQPCQYTNFSASLWIAYDSWLDQGDKVLWHEYGHAWSLYYAYIVQQDPSLSGYLAARGLTGNPNLGTSKQWDPKEIFAEDYRQLFGSPNAQSYPQANTSIPPAASVPGLKFYLQTTYTQPPSPNPCSSSTSSSAPSAPTTPAVAVSNLGVTPQPVSKSGTVSFALNVPASVTVQIVSGSSVVDTLLSGTSEGAGTVFVTWGRVNTNGKRVAAGTYTTKITAKDAAGNTSAASLSFQVS